MSAQYASKVRAASVVNLPQQQHLLTCRSRLELEGKKSLRTYYRLKSAWIRPTMQAGSHSNKKQLAKALRVRLISINWTCKELLPLLSCTEEERRRLFLIEFRERDVLRKKRMTAGPIGVDSFQMKKKKKGKKSFADSLRVQPAWVCKCVLGSQYKYVCTDKLQSTHTHEHKIGNRWTRLHRHLAS